MLHRDTFLSAYFPELRFCTDSKLRNFETWKLRNFFKLRITHIWTIWRCKRRGRCRRFRPRRWGCRRRSMLSWKWRQYIEIGCFLVEFKVRRKTLNSFSRETPGNSPFEMEIEGSADHSNSRQQHVQNRINSQRWGRKPFLNTFVPTSKILLAF